jgi:ABC-2 type transport system ATP-binding protein
MIELINVSKRYRDDIAVDNLNLTINDGEIMGIIGHNGAGKSTTLKMILGLLAPTSGQVRVMGHDMAKNSAAVKQHIGYLPEESPLYENMTVTEYLTFFSKIYNLPKAQAKARIAELLDSLKLFERDRLTGELLRG